MTTHEYDLKMQTLKNQLEVLEQLKKKIEDEKEALIASQIPF